jgi:preprotein translocase subunit SecA
MAGRGTDIKLGEGVTEPKASTIKDPDGKTVEVVEDGGLHIIGSERHESRRIDRQLRGRSGRQGDPGATQFFLSLEDDLMRLFGSERIAKLMDRLGAQEGEVLAHPLITRSIEQAQKRVELQNFQARKRLLEYDDVMNQQREVIYSLRAFALEGGEELKGEALKMVESAVERRVEQALAELESDEEWDFGVLRQDLLMHYLLFVPALEEGAAERPSQVAEAKEHARMAVRSAFEKKMQSLGEYGEQLLSRVMLHVLDEKWKDHLYDLDQLRSAIHYRSWGQKDPLVEYKQEAYTMFVDLMADLYNTFAERFLRAQLVFDAPEERFAPPAPLVATRHYNALGILEDVVPSGDGQGAPASNGGPDGEVDIAPDEPPKKQPVARKEARVVGAGSLAKLAPAPGNTDWSSVGRNDPCPCGSGKKFKKCHGAAA